MIMLGVDAERYYRMRMRRMSQLELMKSFDLYPFPFKVIDQLVVIHYAKPPEIFKDSIFISDGVLAVPECDTIYYDVYVSDIRTNSPDILIIFKLSSVADSGGGYVRCYASSYESVTFDVVFSKVLAKISERVRVLNKPFTDDQKDKLIRKLFSEERSKIEPVFNFVTKFNSKEMKDDSDTKNSSCSKKKRSMLGHFMKGLFVGIFFIVFIFIIVGFILLGIFSFDELKALIMNFAGLAQLVE